MNDLYPSESGYRPTIISYNDKTLKTVVEQGKVILSAFQNQRLEPGYGVVMIHRTVDQHPRDEDRLAAMVMRELREQDFPVTVIHVQSSQECYGHVRDKSGNSHYSVRRHAASKLKGYLRNVALNKILLANHRWPFVLASSLHADITVGIDVKQNTVGLTLVSKNGSDIRWAWKTSRQKERLTTKQMASYLMEIIQQEARVQDSTIRNIAIHRDGVSGQSELEGAGIAIKQLKRDGVLPDDATVTFIEIPKHSQIPLRIFEQYMVSEKKTVRNPRIGTYMIVNNREAYICNTGWPFRHGGTVQPLYVRKVKGPMPIHACIEDVFCLASLTWTRPEDCSRYPITIKLTDRYLCEIAGDYDVSELDMAISENDLRNEGKAI
ncbi:MAG: hypothetical protein ACFFEE_11730 [Candidatus Thorarchaeota archaeon]